MTTDESNRSMGVRDLWKLLLGIVGAAAVVQELRTPPEHRDWHGTVAGIVPYDFRIPTIQRIKDTYWNPEGAIMSGKVFGVGWTPNLGAIVRHIHSVRR